MPEKTEDEAVRRGGRDESSDEEESEEEESSVDEHGRKPGRSETAGSADQFERLAGVMELQSRTLIKALREGEDTDLLHHGAGDAGDDDVKFQGSRGLAAWQSCVARFGAEPRARAEGGR